MLAHSLSLLRLISSLWHKIPPLNDRVSTHQMQPSYNKKPFSIETPLWLPYTKIARLPATCELAFMDTSGYPNNNAIIP